jgi:ABC-2 type transport system ATP-binding protein
VGVDPQSRNHIFEMIAKLRREGMSLIYTTHYMEEAERLCDRIAIVDHGKVIALGAHAELVQNAFGSRSQVLARFAGASEGVAAWAAERGGQMVDKQGMDGQSMDGQSTDGAVQFTVDHPSEIAGLLESSAKAGFQLVDISVRKPNLESVFLHLTGRELRD